MMTKQKKSQEISNLVERFGKAKAAFLVDFKGMNVEQATDLRKKLHPAEGEMKVVRNTLARLALKDSPDYEAPMAEEFVGTNAIVFAYGDVSAPAKVLTQFGKDVEALKIKTGAMDGAKLDNNQIKFLATLPGRDELRASLLGTLQAPMGTLVRTLNEVPSGFVRVVGAYKDKQA